MNTTTTTMTATQGLALFGALTAAFDAVHPAADQWAQRDLDARCKGLHGDHPVTADGKPDPDGPYTASQLGRRAVMRHVAGYTAVQLGTTLAVTRAVGCRIPARALLAGTAINALTHAVIDRRAPLMWAARKLGKDGYVEHCNVVRQDPGTGEYVTDPGGPGTALMELDQAAHRAIGLAAAAVTTWLTIRAQRGRGTQR